MIRIAPADTWSDFERLMGPRGGAEGCWCMLWRLRAKDYAAGRGDPNREAMRALFAEGPPGLLAHDGEIPIGWCSVAPRQAFPRLANSRNLAPVDDAPVWSVTCFFIARAARGRGVATALLPEACAFAARHGATMIEGYPVDPGEERETRFLAWTGYQQAFLRCGFHEVARRSPKRPVMRKDLS